MNKNLLKDQKITNDAGSLYQLQDDVQTLRCIFSLPDINYSDISQHENLKAALARWPLLAEFSEIK